MEKGLGLPEEALTERRVRMKVWRGDRGFGVRKGSHNDAGNSMGCPREECVRCGWGRGRPAHPQQDSNCRRDEQINPQVRKPCNKSD